MAYIAPDGVIRLLANVPIDADYVHTLWFDSVASQTAYFELKALKTFTNVSYTRKGRGVIKVECPADQIYGCNYMMYRNVAFSEKWFYAFITSVEYISNKVSQVTFQIDLLQTWFFQINFKECFIERQHATVDYAGSNLVPEGLEGGEYVYNDGDYEWCHNWSTYDVLALTSFQSSLTPTGTWQLAPGTNSQIYSGILTGLSRRLFRNIRNQNTMDSLRSFLNTAVTDGYADGVVALLMIPSEFHNDDGSFVTGVYHSVPRINSIDGYVPRNKKLLTYPYVFIEEQNCEGVTAIFPQEYFVSAQETPNLVNFIIEFSESAAPIAGCTPLNYKNSVINKAESMYINSFVQGSWNVDLFKAYLAQSLTAKVGNQITDAIAGPVNTTVSDTSHVWNNLFRPLVTGDESSRSTYQQQEIIPQNAFSNLTADVVRSGAFPAMALAASAYPVARMGTPNLGLYPEELRNRLELAGKIYDAMQDLYAKSVAPPHNNGCNSPDFFTGRDEKGFWFFHRTIRREFAEKIDKYFDMFGYAIHNVAIPNLHARQRYTYIKTVGAQVDGAVPSEAISLMQNVLNKGITFWADHNDFGNYSLPNPII